MGLTVLAGSIGWVAGDRATRRAETERAITETLIEAAAWQQEGRLPEALTVARRAVWLADTGAADEDLRQRVQTRRADLELVAELEEARLQRTAVKEGHFDIELGDRSYSEAAGRCPEPSSARPWPVPLIMPPASSFKPMARSW
jgi:hypothetical protein